MGRGATEKRLLGPCYRLSASEDDADAEFPHQLPSPGLLASSRRVQSMLGRVRTTSSREMLRVAGPFAIFFGLALFSFACSDDETLEERIARQSNERFPAATATQSASPNSMTAAEVRSLFEDWACPKSPQRVTTVFQAEVHPSDVGGQWIVETRYGNYAMREATRVFTAVGAESVSAQRARGGDSCR